VRLRRPRRGHNGSVPTYVALLRGVNVGGRSPLAMADLRALFVDLGHAAVRTYIQSGNVVFASPRTDQAALAAELEAGLAERLAVRSPVITRSAPELGRIAAGHPFAAEGLAPATLHVTFLAATPDPALVEALEPPVAAGERWAVLERQVYLYCPDGYGRTKLNNGYFERRLKVAATTRNWKTVGTLAEMAGA